MAKVVNTIDNKIRTTGGKQAAESITQVTKAQTRLGQSAASAGRQFSAQASGLGGLVSAYAGAAATVFALQQAFAALNAAARAEQTVKGVNALAAAVGVSGPEIIKQIKEITQGQLSLAESAELINLGLSAGLGEKQLAGLAEVAVKASKALGRDLSDSLNRVIRGVAKLEPELLDELGLFTRIEPAAEAYAKALGKTVGQLSNFEKRQAFANAALDEGNDKFGTVDTSGETAAKSLERLVATLSDIGVQFGQLIANTLQPFIDILGNGTTAIFAFGALLRVVGGVALREITGGLDNLAQKAQGLSTGFLDLVTSEKRLIRSNKLLAESTQQVNLRSAISAKTEPTVTKELLRKARAQTITITETKKLNAIAAQEVALLKKRKAALESNEKSSKAFNRQLTTTNNRLAAFNTVLKSTNTRLKATPGFLRKTAAGLQIVTNAAITAASAIAAFVNKFFLIASIVAVLGTVASAILDFLGLLDSTTEKIGNFFSKIKNFLNLSDVQRATRDVRKEFQELAGVEIGTANANAYRSIIEATGKSLSAIRQETGDQVKQGAVLLKGASELYGELAKRVQFANAAQKDLTEEVRNQRLAQNKIANENLAAQRVAITLNKLLEGGTGTIEKIEQRRGAVNNLINRLLTDSRIEVQKIGRALKEQLNQTDKQANRQLAILRITDQIRKTFSAQIKAADELSKSLTIVTDEEGKRLEFAESSKKQREIQIQQLTRAFAFGKKQLELERDGLEQRGRDKKLADLANIAQKALLGTFTETLKASQDLSKELIKRNTANKEATKQAEAQLDLVKAQFDIEKARKKLDDERSRSGNEKTLLDANKKLNDVLIDRKKIQQESLKEAAGRLLEEDPLLSKGEKMKLQLFIKAQDLRALQVIQEQEKLNILQRAKIEEQRIKAEIQFQKSLKGDSEKADVGLIAKREDAELKLLNRRIDADQKRSQFEIDTLKAQNQLTIDQLKNFTTHIDGIAAVLAADLTERQRLQEAALRPEGGGFSISVRNRLDEFRKRAQRDQDPAMLERLRRIDAFGGDVGRATVTEENAGQISNILNMQQTRGLAQDLIQKTLKDLEQNNFKELQNSLKQRIEARRELESIKIGNKATKERDAATRALADAETKLTALGINTQASLEELTNQFMQGKLSIENFADATKRANDTFLIAANRSKETIENSFVKGLEDLNQAFIDGTLTIGNLKEGFKDFAAQLVRSIQQIFFTETIAKPAAGGLMKMLGLGSDTPSSIMSSGFDAFSFLPSGFGAGGDLGSMLTASGGMIPKLAAGGRTTQRDRVPALLEPGEFVMQRKAVSAAGLPAMQQMNAGGMPPISVNIRNEGTPQEATSATPNIDVDKIVIDVVTRDLRNNGPIRQSMRGGG